MAASKTSRQMVEARAREEKAIALRRRGASLRQIAKEVGYASTSSAHAAIIRSLRKTAEATHKETLAFRQQEVERLDELQMSAWTAAVGGMRPTGQVDMDGNAVVEYVPPDMQALGNVLRIVELRSKLLGLFPAAGTGPTHIEASVSIVGEQSNREWLENKWEQARRSLEAAASPIVDAEVIESNGHSNGHP